ncbi:MAG: hypothetical protein PHU49_00825 [Syntrophorhabdaceae bacterium]|nr:hypothetical protein [Syntrophorhabdaceae bacterium]MDD5242535.1 hypothetical protein [Syntrophorhabdaceae bacterium]
MSAQIVFVGPKGIEGAIKPVVIYLIAGDAEKKSRSSLFRQHPAFFKWFTASIHTASLILGNVQ